MKKYIIFPIILIILSCFIVSCYDRDNPPCRQRALSQEPSYIGTIIRIDFESGGIDPDLLVYYLDNGDIIIVQYLFYRNKFKIGDKIAVYGSAYSPSFIVKR